MANSHHHLIQNVKKEILDIFAIEAVIAAPMQVEAQLCFKISKRTFWFIHCNGKIQRLPWLSDLCWPKVLDCKSVQPTKMLKMFFFSSVDIQGPFFKSSCDCRFVIWAVLPIKLPHLATIYRHTTPLHCRGLPRKERSLVVYWKSKYDYNILAWIKSVVPKCMLKLQTKHVATVAM